jgi:hypothetical protein
MNAVAAPPLLSDATAVDARNPWLGLASFTEETQAYFYGREDEVAELARRVQRKLLTVLFGQSGLGKTSILRAGLVPRLRAQGLRPRNPPSRSSSQSRAPRSRRASGPRSASPPKANRCGNFCIIATTCCATKPAIP